MELLQPLECYDHVGLGIEFLGFFTEQLLGVEVFLEVVVAQILVDLQLVVEPLYGCLVAFPLVGQLLGGNFASGLEFLLQFAEAGEVLVDIVGVAGHVVELGDYGVLLLEVGLAFGFDGGQMGGFLVLDHVEQRLEAFFGFVGGRCESLFFIAFFNECGFFGFQFGVAQRVELLFSRLTSSRLISAPSLAAISSAISSICSLVSGSAC